MDQNTNFFCCPFKLWRLALSCMVKAILFSFSGKFVTRELGERAWPTTVFRQMNDFLYFFVVVLQRMAAWIVRVKWPNIISKSQLSANFRKLQASYIAMVIFSFFLLRPYVWTYNAFRMLKNFVLCWWVCFDAAVALFFALEFAVWYLQNVSNAPSVRLQRKQQLRREKVNICYWS